MRRSGSAEPTDRYRSCPSIHRSGRADRADRLAPGRVSYVLAPSLPRLTRSDYGYGTSSLTLSNADTASSDALLVRSPAVPMQSADTATGRSRSRCSCAALDRRSTLTFTGSPAGHQERDRAVVRRPHRLGVLVLLHHDATSVHARSRPLLTSASAHDPHAQHRRPQDAQGRREEARPVLISRCALLDRPLYSLCNAERCTMSMVLRQLITPHRRSTRATPPLCRDRALAHVRRRA